MDGPLRMIKIGGGWDVRGVLGAWFQGTGKCRASRTEQKVYTISRMALSRATVQVFSPRVHEADTTRATPAGVNTQKHY